MITRRALLGGAGAALLAAPSPAWAQKQGPAPPLIGTLTGGTAPSEALGPSTSDKAFLEGMRGLGYMEAQTIRVEAVERPSKFELKTAKALKLTTPGAGPRGPDHRMRRT